MVYAMFSIGILGFLVWSQIMVALSYCKIRVRNFAVCRDSSTLLCTFYSKNLSNYTQSAGNPKFNNASSSETKREASSKYNFSAFRNLYLGLGFTSNISDTWLLWFIGFVEGDGALLSYKGRPRFVLTQKEGFILEHIKNVLGFGIVRKFNSGGSEYSRYIVDEINGILLLSLIFNGHLVLPRRIEQLSRWLEDLNEKLKNPNSNIFNLGRFLGFTGKGGLRLTGLTSEKKIILVNSLFIPSLNEA
jgi:hypothetical protein